MAQSALVHRLARSCVCQYRQPLTSSRAVPLLLGRPQTRSAGVLAKAQSGRGGGLGDEDIDVAVFRFTLGIPGFEDRLIPRVVGVAIGALLAINHVVGAQPTPDAQLRSEWLGVLLATLCFFVPDIEERLREAMPGRGRQKTAEVIEGASNCFFLDPSLPDASKKELAWASFSLLKNTNCCGALVACGAQVVMARGAMGSGVVTPGDAARSLSAMSQDLAPALASSGTGSLGAVTRGSAPQAWLPERGTWGAAGLAALAALPKGAQSAVAQHISLADGRPAVLLAFSERPRALSDRERGWVAAIANKLAAFL